MSFADFMNATKKEVGTVEYAAASNLLDADGKPLMWTIRPLKTAEIEAIRKQSTRKVKDPKTGLVSTEIDGDRFEASIVTKAVVVPDLTNKELQDHYNCLDPIALLQTLVDIPGDYALLVRKINEMSHLSMPDVNQLVDDAKN